MSLDLSVLMEKKISKRLLGSVNTFLTVNGFVKGDYGYSHVDDEISLNVYIDLEPEKDDYSDDQLTVAIGFVPMTVISLESRHDFESHQSNYHFAKQLAKLVDGVIYDHQVGVIYDFEGKPYACYRTDGDFKEYGAGAELFMQGLRIAKDTLGES
ncbi:hypothetical protein ES703_97944 [subsurface metagenome]